MQWARSRGNWTLSDFGGLPSVQTHADPLLQRWQIVAGGLALVLSRLSQTERSARFPATYRLYQGLRRRLRQAAEVDAAPELLSEVMHEIAGVADIQTTQCLRTCFDARLGNSEAVRQAPGQATDSLSSSQLQSQPRPRISTLRGTLAAARAR